MKTALISTCYLEGNDDSGSNRLDRNIRWCQYMLPLRQLLGFDDLWLLDNASDDKHILKLLMAPGCDKIQFHRFNDHLEKAGPEQYPYLWRALYYIDVMIERGYTKFLFIDTDMFILSKRLAHWVKVTNHGWPVLWCSRHQFPEAGLHILNQDSFQIYKQFINKQPWESIRGVTMETELPFTEICRQFNVDRFGETTDEIPPNCDAFGQASLRTKFDVNRLLMQP